MVVDLGREQAGLVEGALDRGCLVDPPLAPEAGADQRGERNHRGDHQSQKA